MPESSKAHENAAGVHAAAPRAAEQSAPSPQTNFSERKHIAVHAGVVAAGTLLSRILGLFREQVIAAVFPLAITDSWFLAFLLPNLLRQLLAEGAMQTAVLPVLAKVEAEQGEPAARALYRKLSGLSLLILTSVSALGVVFAEPLVILFAAGYHGAELSRTVELTRFIFPYLLCMGSAALGAVALNLRRRFVASAFSPALLNVALIAAALTLPAWFAERHWDTALALAVGALIGGILQVVAQWPSLRQVGYLGLPQFGLRDPGIREIFRRMAPVLFGVGVYYVDVIFSRRFLSDLGPGAQSYFMWARLICDFPQGIFVMAVQTVSLASLSRLAAERAHGQLASAFVFGLRLVLFVSIPASVLAVTLAEPLVVLLFQRGAFQAAAAHETAQALVAQGFGIAAVAIVRQFVSLYYAFGDTRTPVWIAAIDFLAFLGLAFWLSPRLGHVGVSVALTGSSVLQMLLLMSLARRKLNFSYAEVAYSAFRVLSAALIAAFAVRLLLRTFQTQLAAQPALAGIFGTIGFLVVFLVAAFFLKSPEFTSLLDALRRKLRKARAS